MTDHLPAVRRLISEGHGDHHIAGVLGVTRHAARELMNELKLEDARGSLQILGDVGTPTGLYETACRALAAAVRVDEVKSVLDVSVAIEAYARQAKNKDLEADAVVLRQRGKRRLGEILIEAKRVGQIADGRPKTVPDSEQFPRVTLEGAGIDRKLSMSCQKTAKISAAAHEAMIAKMREEIVSGRRSLDTLKVATTSEKQDRRERRERELACKILALPDKRYGVILADPEWRYEAYSKVTGLDRAPENYYPTSETAAIAARPVQDIAANDCVLFLWATQAMLLDAVHVMAAWGFTYKSQFIWRKSYPGQQTGIGHWNRSVHELLLIGTRGDIPGPAPGTQFTSIITAEVRGHSVKPEWQYELIDAYFPNLPKIELNARRARQNWDNWGLDAPPHDPETGEVTPSTSAQEAAE
jgi:N6-adenosine-specific RNA methylase IME4/nucleotide-binding universal stress UspA family protein